MRLSRKPIVVGHSVMWLFCALSAPNIRHIMSCMQCESAIGCRLYLHTAISASVHWMALGVQYSVRRAHDSVMFIFKFNINWCCNCDNIRLGSDGFILTSGSFAYRIFSRKFQCKEARARSPSPAQYAYTEFQNRCDRTSVYGARVCACVAFIGLRGYFEKILSARGANWIYYIRYSWHIFKITKKKSAAQANDSPSQS